MSTGGRVVGPWEDDIEAREIVYQAFVKPDGALKEAVARTNECVRDQLGDARNGEPAKIVWVEVRK